MNNFNGKIWLFFVAVVLALFFGSCKSKKAVMKSEIKEHGFQYLYDKLLENQTIFDFYSSKFTIDYQQGNNKTSLRGQIRIKSDSIIWISFTPALGIEAARVMLTDDSIKFINRLNKTYFSGKYNLVDSVLNTTINYALLQSMLIGNDLMQYDVQKFRSSVDNKLYRLTIRERRKIKRFMKKGEIDTRVLVQQIWLYPDNYRIARIDVKEQGVDDNNKLRVFYDEYIQVGDQLLPSRIRIEIVSLKSIFINVEFSREELNSSLRFPFRIPSKYENLF